MKHLKPRIVSPDDPLEIIALDHRVCTPVFCAEGVYLNWTIYSSDGTVREQIAPEPVSVELYDHLKAALDI